MLAAFGHNPFDCRQNIEVEVGAGIHPGGHEAAAAKPPRIVPDADCFQNLTTRVARARFITIINLVSGLWYLGFIGGVNPLGYPFWFTPFVIPSLKARVAACLSVLAVFIRLGLIPNHAPAVDRASVVTAENAVCFQLGEQPLHLALAAAQ